MSKVLTNLPRQEVRAFWSGPDLSFYEQLSLKSMLASGARVLLYTYEKTLSVPHGVELVDANEILPWPSDSYGEVNRNSSFALHSDLFRYVALHRFGGWYIDLDLILLQDRLPSCDTFLAYAGTDWVNTAVMKFPAGSPVMAEAIMEAQRLLPETDLSQHTADRGIVGPALMTQLVRKNDLAGMVLPQIRAFEIKYDEALDFFNPVRCSSIEARLAQSDFTHLWNEVTRFVRIPKNFGPPEGSFLDLLFQKYGIEIAPRARMSYASIEAWNREYRLVRSVKKSLATEVLGDNAFDDFVQSLHAQQAQASGASAYPEFASAKLSSTRMRSQRPQTIKTFWHGTEIGPYPLMGFKSFADRGHRVEVFTYSTDLKAPDWISVRDAAEILPRERVLRPIDAAGRFAIHANLFRYALLHRAGGWWVDPDVVLMKPDLPEAEVYVAGRNEFGFAPVSLLKFPAGHGLLTAALAEIEMMGDAPDAWDSGGSPLLTTLAPAYGISQTRQAPLGPVSWYGVADLFDPSKAETIREKCAPFDFLHLHHDVWRRAGIPVHLAPPEGSFLDLLLVERGLSRMFSARMSFGDLNRWLAHMYQCVRAG